MNHNLNLNTMEITLNKTEDFQVIQAIMGYDHTVVEEADDERTVEMGEDDIDDLAKETGRGEYFKCRITRFGNTTVEDLFFNYLTDSWEHYASHGAEIHELSEDELEEYRKDQEIEDNATGHPRWEEYREYCSDWQTQFNGQFAYHGGNSNEAVKIMGSGPASFAEFLKREQ